MGLRLPAREELAAAIIAPIVIAVAAFLWIRRTAAADSAPTVSLEAPIAPDSARIAGTLSNDLRYYIRRNHWPTNRIELRLAVNAGSVQESANQHGLAHAVEHMVFRGTKSFPGHAIDNYLTSIGMRPGNDVNASTSPDETIYSITIPANRPGVVDTALHILADMVSEATFDPAEARQEAGVVMEEWRLGSNSDQRAADARNRLLVTGTSYADHTTIGDTATLRRFDLAEMRRFYDDWYRPDLMAVVVVGDIDPQETELLVRKTFNRLRPRGARTPRDVLHIPSGAARAAVLHDPETRTPRLTLWHADSAIVPRTLGDYRRVLIREVWQDIVSDRLDETTEQRGSPILNAYAGYRSPARSLEASFVTADFAPGRDADALDTLMASIARLSVYPVSVGELHRHTAAILRQRRSSDEWADNSDDLADDLVSEFLQGGVGLTRGRRYELARDLLPTVAPSDIQDFARSFTIGTGTLLTSIGRDVSDSSGRAQDMLERARRAFDAPARPTSQASARTALMTTLPQAGKVVAETTLNEARIYDWRLSNGMRVILKPTRFTSDNLEFQLVAPGGASLATDNEYPSAFFADHVLLTTGIGDISGRELARHLDETSIDVSPTMSDDALRFSGSASPRDLDQLFQVLHLYLTAPRSDTAAFRRYKERRESEVQGRRADPDAVFSDSVAVTVAQHHSRALHNDLRTSRAIDLTTALRFWRARTSNGSNFTFVMVGDFTVDRARTLVERYLGSIPAGRVEQPRNAGITFPQEVQRRTIAIGADPRARTRIVLSGKYDGTSEASDQLTIASDLAEMALSDRLRERMGGTYDVSVSSSVDLIPPGRYFITIDFGGAPERMNELTTAALAELERLRTSGPAQDEFTKLRATRVRDREGKDTRNSYWADELSWHARLNWRLDAISNHKIEASMLSRGTAQTAAARYLNAAAYVQVTMNPRAKAAH